MKRLLCIISGMNAGGAETFLMKIYRALDKSKYQMDFCINTKEKCFYENEITDMGGKIYRIPSKSENTAEFQKQLTAVVSENSYQYVMRITSNAMGFMDLKIAKQAGASVCIARSSNSSDGEGMKAWLAHRLGRFLYGKYVDIKIAPSDLAAEYTFGKTAFRRGAVHILHNAVDVDFFAFSEQDRTAVRQEFGIPENAFVVGHIGRFMKQKNHMFLLEVFQSIQKQQSNVKLLLVGNGIMENQLRDQCGQLGIQDDVIFAGVRSDIRKLLSAMDVFVFPSLYEGMPNTVIEAQANGLPCIISDTITREANITGLVTYLPLTKSPKEWGQKTLSIPQGHQNQKEKFMLHRYDIASVVNDFTKLVFQE